LPMIRSRFERDYSISFGQMHVAEEELAAPVGVGSGSAGVGARLGGSLSLPGRRPPEAARREPLAPGAGFA